MLLSQLIQLKKSNVLEETLREPLQLL